ncbi:MAG: hypothetical protein AAGF60_16590 [Pseudomonadota bacterium]
MIRMLAALPLAACAAPATELPNISAERLIPEYRGVETRLLDDDLVQFNVAMTNALSEADVSDYARCAAAQYALIRGYGFARHVRTSVAQEGDLWTGDAAYVISPGLPQGLRTIDAEVTVAACKERQIPTV